MPQLSSEITQLLHSWQAGEPGAETQLADAVYGELRQIAVQRLRQERDGHTLQATALLHEAYLRLRQVGVDWADRGHFFAFASQMMRRILVDHARARATGKRGHGRTPLRLEEATAAVDDGSDLLALDLALDRLAVLDARQARIVELRFFGGLGEADIAREIGITARSVRREWAVARAWLHRELYG